MKPMKFLNVDKDHLKKMTIGFNFSAQIRSLLCNFAIPAVVQKKFLANHIFLQNSPRPTKPPKLMLELIDN